MEIGFFVVTFAVGVPMKFSCERCQTRYSIGDEKVKGKVLKIRCKTCGNIIVVREQIPTVQGEASGFAVPQQREAAMAAIGGAASSPAMATNPSVSLPPQQQPHQQQQQAPQRAAASNDHDWYVAIKGKQHGPAKAADIVRLFKDGKITDRTYLWHDQLPSWTRLKDLAEFAAIVADGPAPKRAPPPPPSEDGGELINFEQARAQRQSQQQPQQNNLGPVTSDPFAAIQGQPGIGGDNAPRESTRVFIMQAGLHNRAKKQKLYAGVAVFAVLGFVLLCAVDYQLDILGLKNVVNAVAVSTGIKDAPIEPTNEWGEEGGGDPTLRCKLMPDPDKCVRDVKKTIAKKRIAKAKAEGKTVSDADLKDAFGSGGESAGGDIGRKGTIDDNGMIVMGTGPTSDEIKKALGTGKGGPTGPKATIETPSVAGTTIDADNASKVVRDGQAAIQTCVDEAMKRNEDLPGKVRMTVAINVKGVVDVAKFNDAVVNASGLGGCITKAAKRWKFAPPTEAADLEIPLVLR